MMTAKRTARVVLGVLVLAGVAICQTKAVRVHEPARRLALVIGNAAYPENGLANPEGDAELIEATLQGLGFDEVVRETDLETLPALRGAVLKFGRGLLPNDLAFFYYSGHGLQAPGGDRGETRNYLLPTRYDWKTPLEEVQDNALSFERVRRVLGKAQLRVMVLDACRTYKLGKSEGGGGLAPTFAAEGELIAYATGPDKVATDEGDGAGIYAQELAGALRERGVEVASVFRKVMVGVHARTEGAQLPELRQLIVGDLYLNGQPEIIDSRQPWTREWQALEGIENPAMRGRVAAYIKKYRDEARARDEVGKAEALLAKLEGMVERKTANERWDEIKDTEDDGELERFLERYGGRDGAEFWTKLAEQHLESLRKKSKRDAKRREAEAAWAHVRSAGTAEAARLFVDTYGAVAPDLAREATAMLERLRDAEKKVRVAGQGSRNPLGMEFVRIPAGTFVMGSPEDEEGRYSRERQHEVRISQDFWMGKYEVTQAEWNGVMGANPSSFKRCGSRCPVESVSWDDIQEFIRRLNEQESGSGYVYRLPTEAEWEYAARAGTTGARHGELDSIAWYSGNSGRTTHPVGRKRANGWGLHDMLGNVWEWMADWYGYYPSGMVADPRGPSTGEFRVFRGGGWNSGAGYVRSANRFLNSPGDRYDGIGFRLVRTE